MKACKSRVRAQSAFLSLMVLLFCCGCCAGLKEGLRGFAGVSTKDLEARLPSAAAKDFDLSYSQAYSATMDILKEMKAYIYAIDNSKNLVAIYVSEQDTTPVGIFFKQIYKTKTQVLVSSPSTYAKELISGKIFTELEKSKP
jgi:hypothetical protein